MQGKGGGPVRVYILNFGGKRRRKKRGCFSCFLCSMSFKGTVLSHDVNKELTGIAHGVLKRLPTGGELRRNGG